MRRPEFRRSRFAPFGWHRVGRFTDLVVALGLLGLLAIAGAVLQHRLGPQREAFGMATAIDGDSLRLNGEELRLEGLDAPEYRQSCHEPGGGSVPCGRVARAALAEMLRSGEVACTISRPDRYGRGLARCTVDGRDVGARLVAGGHAVAYGSYSAEEREAKQARRGIWALSFERPEIWRRSHGR